ncbi:hypothetical protein MA16_Dca027641 [Dendrobium catenatum]|uniref:Uncharacterized protein n=1 Tax=Dendrobium catenatum TaxID=906689 RepID=A0A2I0XBF1_9ASPA|nr:hypothetical protein MA16_Dca027641 [Dendrobium catenatum]
MPGDAVVTVEAKSVLGRCEMGVLGAELRCHRVCARLSLCLQAGSLLRHEVRHKAVRALSGDTRS